jgi:hypothetical protein
MMKRIEVIFAAFVMVQTLSAQSLPTGTTLPVTLTSSLSQESRPSQTITARVMQAISIPGLRIPAGAQMVGHVLRIGPSDETGTQLSLRFDRIAIHKGGEIPLIDGLRAIASPTEINNAEIPKAGPDEGISPYSWTTVQVGGDVRYGTGGPVMAGGTEVGKGVPGGVVARIKATPGSECSQLQSTSQPQSLWVFSSGACEVYGFADLKIQQSGLTAPVGEIMLSSSRILKLPEVPVCCCKWLVPR